MAHINLLPWRDVLKKEREIRFFMMTGIALAICGAIFFGIYMYINTLISYQQSRNDFLKSAITVAKGKIKEIEELEAEKANVEKRIKVIEKLQLSRPEAVYLFNEICKIPDGVYYRGMTQEDYAIALDGEAQSPARVSSLMDNLSNSKWLRNPDLELVQEIDKNEKNREFRLNVQQISPEEIDEQKKKDELEANLR